MMKRKWIGIAAGTILLVMAGGFYLVFVNPLGDIDIEGRWELASGPEDCFDGVRFMRGATPKKGGASTTEAAGNIVQMSYGTYVKSGDKLTLSLSNPPAPPLDLKISREGEDLQLNYSSEGRQLSCVYSPDK